MSGFIGAYQAVFDLLLINGLVGLSQYIVLRAGVFSVATAGLGAVGAYTTGNLVLNAGWQPELAMAVGDVASVGVAVVLSIPLARLRGVFQAIATLAFVQIVVSIALYADRFTGGATGLNGIPASAGTLEIVIVLALALWLLHNIGRSPMGRAFDTIRQDEHVAVAFGIDVVRHHTIAFALSGLLAGLAGGLLALHNYSVVPDEFGFSMLVAGLSYVIFGGRQSLGGPILGAAILTVLPEVSRPLADNRMILYGGLLMWTVIYLPHGLFDTALARWRLRRSGSSKVETTTATTASMPAAVVDSPAGELPSVMTR